MDYIDFTYYTETYKGSTIPEAAFSRFAMKAENKVDLMTFNRIDTEADYMERVRMCCCEIADSLYSIDVSENTQSAGSSGIVSSERVGDYSVSYVDVATTNSMNAIKIKSIATEWLGLTGLLYRGVC